MAPRRYPPASLRVVAEDSDSDVSAEDTRSMHEQQRSDQQMAQMAAIAMVV